MESKHVERGGQAATGIGVNGFLAPVELMR
jgi:hypothetical protein